MICKNGNNTVLNFGSGDIIVSVIYNDNNGISGVTFQQDDIYHLVGETADFNNNVNINDQDVIMTFSNIESIDAIIKQLNYAKEVMIAKGDKNA